MTPEIITLTPDNVQAAIVTVEDTTTLFDDTRMTYRAVPGRAGELYAPWGADNLLPFRLAELVGSDEVTAQNKFFNVLACYGAGPQLNGPDGKPTTNPDIRTFARRNALTSFFLEQVTDCKYYFMAVCVVILSRDGSRVNRIVHKDAC